MLIRKPPTADDGFTLVEVLSALAVIGVVLTAVTTFLVSSMTTINLQGARQVAIQVASTSLEQLRALSGIQAVDWLMDRVDAGKSDVPNTAGPVPYQQTWTCTTDTAPCVASTLKSTLTTTPLLLTAAVKITWRSKACAGNECSYAAATKMSVASFEPYFEQSS